MTPRERYMRDPSFKVLVDMLCQSIHQAQYTPTELREAVILASIMYHEKQPPQPVLFEIKTGDRK